MPDDSMIKPLIIANRAEVKRMFITEYDEAAIMEKFKKEYFCKEFLKVTASEWEKMPGVCIKKE